MTDGVRFRGTYPETSLLSLLQVHIISVEVLKRKILSACQRPVDWRRCSEEWPGKERGMHHLTPSWSGLCQQSAALKSEGVKLLASKQRQDHRRMPFLALIDSSSLGLACMFAMPALDCIK